MEALTIYGLVVALALLFANPFALITKTKIKTNFLMDKLVQTINFVNSIIYIAHIDFYD
jgi:hypothetical protein